MASLLECLRQTRRFLAPEDYVTITETYQQAIEGGASEEDATRAALAPVMQDLIAARADILDQIEAALGEGTLRPPAAVEPVAEEPAAEPEQAEAAPVAPVELPRVDFTDEARRLHAENVPAATWPPEALVAGQKVGLIRIDSEGSPRLAPPPENLESDPVGLLEEQLRGIADTAREAVGQVRRGRLGRRITDGDPLAIRRLVDGLNQLPSEVITREFASVARLARARNREQLIARAAQGMMARELAATEPGAELSNTARDLIEQTVEDALAQKPIAETVQTVAAEQITNTVIDEVTKVTKHLDTELRMVATLRDEGLEYLTERLQALGSFDQLLKVAQFNSITVPQEVREGGSVEPLVARLVEAAQKRLAGINAGAAQKLTRRPEQAKPQAQFASSVLASAQNVPQEGRVGRDLVLINAVYRQYQADGGTPMSLDEFKAKLKEAWDAEAMPLAIANVLDPKMFDDVRESSIRDGRQEWQVIDLSSVAKPVTPVNEPNLDKFWPSSMQISTRGVRAPEKTVEEIVAENEQKPTSLPLMPSPPRPSGMGENDYVAEALRNLRLTSRTAAGVVDTSASAGKAEKMAEGLTGETAKGKAIANFEQVIRKLYSRLDEIQEMTPQQLYELADNVALDINEGILRPGALLRTDDSPTFPYTAAAKLEGARRQFAEELAQRLADPEADPVETAAWIEWRVNLTDHAYADGVGKTSKALAYIPLMIAGEPLPLYRSNAEFFERGNKTQRDPDQGPESYLDREWRTFLSYYQTLMPAEPFSRQDYRRREAAARLIMTSDEWSQATIPDMSRDTEKQPGYGTPEWKARRTYNQVGSDDKPSGSTLTGYESGIQYLIDRASAKVPGGVKAERKLFLLLGFPGAGKSTIAKKIAARHGAMHLVGDDAKLIIPEYDGGANSGGVHEEASAMMKDVVDRMMMSSNNITVEKLGSSDGSIVKMIDKFRAAGYSVNVINVNAPKALAMERAISRWQQVGRAVPLSEYDKTASNLPGLMTRLVEQGRADETNKVTFNENADRWELDGVPGLEVEGLWPRAGAPAGEPRVDGVDRGPSPPGGSGRSSPEAEQAEDGTGRVTPAQTVSAPTIEQRVDVRIEAYGKPVTAKARAYLITLEQIGTDHDLFYDLTKKLRGKSAKAGDVISAAAVYAAAKPRTRATAIAAIEKEFTRRQQAESDAAVLAGDPSILTRDKEKATNDRRRAKRAERLREVQGALPDGSLPEGVSADAEGRDAGGAPRGDGAGSEGSVRPDQRGDAVSGEPDSGQLGGDGREAGSDTGDGERDRAGGSVANAAIVEATEKAEKERKARRRQNYRITDEDDIGGGGPKAKVRANIEAIRVAKELAQNPDRQATPEEKRKLVKYTGWGAFAQAVFDTNRYSSNAQTWAKERQELADLLTAEEYEAARASTINAHFTSKDVIDGMWQVIEHLGFNGGRAIEPAVGAGHFIGLTPQKIANKTDWTAVELDPTTGQIAKSLYAGSDVRIAGFQDVAFPNDFFDLAISNVPFDETTKIKYQGNQFLVLHDYFFAQALDKVRPGGIVAFITSSGTMDKQGKAARRLLASKADLIGAIRLPGGDKGAFSSNAGTEVTTDIIFLRKRGAGEQLEGTPAWLETVTVQTPEGPTRINEYYAQRPEMMLGEMRLIGEMYRAKSPVLIGSPENLAARIMDAAKHMPAKVFTQRTAGIETPVQSYELVEPGTKEGQFFTKKGKLFQNVMGAAVPQKASGKVLKRLRSLIDMRDTVNALMAKQYNSAAVDTSTDDLRKQLNTQYDAFVKEFGPLGKEVVTRSMVKPKRGEPYEQVRRSYPNQALFNTDPDAFKVFAIEEYNAETGKAFKRAIFSTDIVKPYKRPAVSGPVDALAVSLNEVGAVDMVRIAEMLNVSEAEAAAALGDRVFKNPSGEEWQTAELYLSGDVVAKLDQAKTAAERDPTYQRNVAALEAVQPTPLNRLDIRARFGAPWIPSEVYNDFIGKVIGIQRRVKWESVSSMWVWEGAGRPDAPSSAEDAYGTARVKAADIVMAALNDKAAKVYDEDKDGTRTPNKIETENAAAKVAQVSELFSGDPNSGIPGWVWEDESRAVSLEALYNRLLNRLVRTLYDGGHLQLPGLAETLTLPNGKVVPLDRTPHRMNAIWRIIQQGNTLIDHAVGSGKTITMIAAGMEMKRLGMIQRPMYVVPNHMLEQFSREFLQAYPGAKILVADKKYMEAKNRKAFAARIASDAWDGIIITHSGFGRIGMRPEAVKEFLDAQMDEIMDAWLEAKSNAGERTDNGKPSRDPTVKQIEKKKNKIKQKLDALLAKERKDQGVSFEELGVDFLFVDEAHQFKNLDYATRHGNVRGLGVNGSQRAEDLFMKIRYLEKSRPGRTTVFATGTPMSRSMAEIYTMQRYLQLETLREYGIDKFDAWAATFGRVLTKTEQGIDMKLKDVASFSKFINVPELSAIYSRVADSVTALDLNLPRPTLKGGQPQVILSQMSDAERAMNDELIKRMEALRGPAEKGEDNHLSLFTKTLQVATDARLYEPNAEFNPNGKIAKLVNNVAEIYRNGQPPALGQIIFLDMGVPSSRAKAKVETPARDVEEEAISKIRSALADEEAFEDVDNEQSDAEKMLVGKVNLYADIVDRLVAAGIPRNEIATIYDAKNDDQKARLFKSVREGKVRILLGSSAKMGVGTNVQTLLTAMHHVDSPWNPADLVQRDGRIIRQGNQNKEVSIFRYITEGSADAYRWQTLARKADFEAQFRAGARGLREAEDIDSPIPEASMLKALATGDPRIMEHAELTREIRELEAAKRSHERVYIAAQQSRAQTLQLVATVEKNLAAYRQDITLVKDLKGDKFRVRLDLPNAQGVVKERKEVGERIRDHILKTLLHSWSSTPERIEIGEISGFKMIAMARKQPDGIRTSFQIEGATTYFQQDGQRILMPDSDPVGIARQFESIVNGINNLMANNENILAARKADLVRLEKLVTPTPFPKALQLAASKARHAELEAALKPQQPAPTSAAPQPPATTEEAIEEMPSFVRGLFAEQEPGDDGQPFAGEKEVLYQLDQRQTRLREALIREIRNVTGTAGVAGDGVGADREGGGAADRTPGSEGADRGSAERDAIGEVLRDPVRLADALDAFLSAELRRDAVAARAAEQGFTVEAFHGTTSAAIDVPNAFIPGADFGFHVGVGTPKAANSRLGYPSTIPEWMSQFFKWMAGVPAQSKEQGNILPLRIRARNPLRLPDVLAVDIMAEWSDPVDMLALLNHPETQAPEALKRFVKGWLAQAKGQSRPAVRRSHAFSRAFAGELERLGYDAIVYKNHAEGYGTDSMMVWKPSQVRAASDFFHPNAAGAEGLRASDAYVEQDLADRLAKLMREEGMNTGQEVYTFDELASIRAFHGSPHDFRRFDMSRIGTGEGVQAYGYGLYFAENEGVARSYRDSLSQNIPKIIGGENDPSLEMQTARRLLKAVRGPAQKSAYGDISSDAAIEAAEEWRRFMREDGIDVDRVIEILRSGELQADPGRMYEVTIDADPKDFLDWDKPLAEQGPKVQAVLRNAFGADLAQEYGRYKPIDLREIEQLAEDMGDRSDVPVLSPNTPEGARAWREAGIVGVRYLDAGSRASGEGSRNYVVFDDSIVKIVRKDGQPVTEQERAEELASMRAFHGSQADFDRFRSDKINTGEGAQVFGYGLYFAESQQVAEYYRDSTAEYNDNVQWLGEEAPNDLQQEIIDQLSGFDVGRGKAPTIADVRMDIIRVVRMIADFDDDGNMVRPKGRAGERYDRQMALLQETAKSGHLIKINRPGRVYEVELDVDPEQMIDYDSPLTEQSDFVKTALAGIPYVRMVLSEPDKFKGNSVLIELEAKLGSREAASQALQAAGIRGVRYLDQNSRGIGSGTRNFVVFDENDIRIVSKDGKPVSAEVRAEMVASLRAQSVQPERGNLRYTPEAQAVLPAVRAEFEQRIRAMFPASIRVDILADKLFGTAGEMYGRFRPKLRLVEMTMAYGPEKALQTAAHEAVHVLRDVFRPGEWRALVERARKLGVAERMANDRDGRFRRVDRIAMYRAFYTAQARRMGMSEADTKRFVERLVEEEIVARMVEEHFARGTRYGEAIDGLLQRLADILDAIVKAFNGQGLSGAGFVIRRMERGEIAKRVLPKPVEATPAPAKPLETAEGQAVAKLWNDGSLRAPSGLDMSPAARKARAEAQGFDTSKVLYHGTDAAFTSFDPAAQGKTTGAPSAGMGFFFTSRPKTADYYAAGKSPNYESASDKAATDRTWLTRRIDTAERLGKADEAAELRQQLAAVAGPNVVPVYLRMQNPLVHDFKGKVFRDESYANIIKKAKAAGHDGVIFRNTYDAGEYGRFDAAMKGRFKSEDIHVVFDANNIRSVNADFADPASPDMMASFVPSTTRSFDMPGYEATVETSNPEDGRTRVYRIAKDGSTVASMALAERESGQWEVIGLRVERMHQGKGLARKMLAAVEDDIGSPTLPDGILTNAAYGRTQSDSPLRVANHIRGGREFDGMWLSPRAVELMREAAAAASGKSDPNAVADAVRDRDVLKGLEATIPDGKYIADRMADEIGKAVPEPSRLDRARAMGFDTSRVWYNGSAFAPEAFSLDFANKQFPNTFNLSAVWFSNSRNRAEWYASKHAEKHNRRMTDAAPKSLLDKLLGRQPAPSGPRALGEVTEVYVRPGKQVVLDMSEDGIYDDLDRTLKQLRKDGVDTIILRGHRDTPELIDGKEVYLDELIVFDPRNIRSVDAAFDDSDSDLIMASLAGNTGQAQPRHLSKLGDLSRSDTDVPDLGLSDLVGMVKESLGMEVRQGRLNPGMKAAMGRLGAKLYGQFNRRTGVARMAIPMDMATLTHEAGHALEIHPTLGAFVDSLKQQHSAELLPLSSPGADQLSEGWAEFVRLWFVDPVKARTDAPMLNAAFRNMLESRDPNLLTALETIQVAYSRLLAASPAGAVASRVQSSIRPTTEVGKRVEEVKKKGARVAIRDWLYALTTGAVDEKHPLKVAVRFLLSEAQRNLGSTLQKGEQLFLKAANDPYKLARMMEHARVHATAILRYGVRLKGRTLPSGPSLQEVLATAFGGREKSQWNDEIAQMFGSYLVARRMNAEWERYHQGYLDNPPDHLIPEAVWGKAQTDLETANPQFKQAARMLDRFMRAHLELKLQNGFISQDLFDELTSRVGYAPLNRIMDDMQASTPMSAKGDNRRQLIYKFKGSTRDFINPIESIISDVYRTQQRIELNNVVRALDKLARAAGPNGGRIAERIPRTDTRVRELDLSSTMDRLRLESEKIMQQAISSGAVAQWDADQMQDELDNLFDQNASETLFSQVETSSRRGERIVYLWEGGERVPIMLGTDQLGEDIFNIFSSVGRLQDTEVWFDAAVLFTQAFRAGVTKSPAYVVVNWFRDQIATWVLSRDFLPGWTGLSGLRDVIANSDIAKRYEFFAGMMGGIDANIIDTMGRGRDAMQLRKSGFFATTGTWDTILRTMEITEAASRMGHMNAAYERLVADGFSEEEAAIEAAYNAHDVMDFSMHGSRMIQAARLVAFLNAQIQGLYASLRTIKGERDAVQNVRDAVTPFLKAAEGTPLSAAEKEALPMSTTYWIKLVSIGLIGLALKSLYWDDPEHEELSRSQMGHTHWFFKIGGMWFRAPKPFELAIFSNLFESMFDRLVKSDPTAPQRFIRSVRETMLLSPEMQVFGSIKSVYGVFTGSLDQVSGKMQYDRSKSDLPMRLQGLPPELQWDAYTSEFSRMMSRMFGVSPYATDKFIRDTFANLGRDALTAGDALLPWMNQMLGGSLPGVSKTPRADKSYEDYIFLSRITRRTPRGAESTFNFWQEMSEDNGRFVTAAKGYDRYLDEFKSPRDAQRFLATLDDERKAYALLEHHYREQDQDLHPLNRAKQVISAMTGIRRQMAEGTLVKEATNKRGRDPEAIVLSPSKQRVVNEILEDMAMREARNAQIVLGKPGWKEREEMPTDGLMKELEAAAPEIADELKWRLSNGRNKVYPYEGVKKVWPEVRKQLLSEEPGSSLAVLRGQARNP